MAERRQKQTIKAKNGLVVKGFGSFLSGLDKGPANVGVYRTHAYHASAQPVILIY